MGQVVARVSSMLADGRAYLAHDQWTAADLAFVCHLAPCLALDEVSQATACAAHCDYSAS